MRWLARLGTLALFVGIGMAGVSTSATPAAADCGSQPSPSDTVGVAFNGHVTDVQEVRDGQFAVTVSVERTLAGPTLRTVTFETGDWAARPFPCSANAVAAAIHGSVSRATRSSGPGRMF